ncbi:hypothetical protein F4677DRAFT_435095 [Hypoxylon crocopeplum]|nr:hypothetical protein F4677DRAFT_435095 [Hypoxylon crocopeplum]
MSSTLLPFLYHTRTILRANPRTTIAFARSLHATSRQLKRSDDIPFSFDDVEESIPLEPARRGTITPSERQVFQRIFADIKARGLDPILHEDALSPPPTGAHATMRIMQQAAQDANKARPIHVGAAQDRQKALLRFPPDLRAAASKALGTMHTQDTRHPGLPTLPENDYIAYDEASITFDKGDVSADEGWKLPAQNISRTVELEAKRYPERKRVEGLITAAKSDFELWDVLEKEVFTMPAKLGLDGGVSTSKETESAKSTGKEKKKGKKKKEKKTKATTADETTLYSEDGTDASNNAEALEQLSGKTDATAAESYPPPEKLHLYIHGPLYPAYLLLALRRLDTAFRAPSLLAFSVLPRIKELGLESYVLGVSTPFYNELLEIYWTRRGDLSGMLDLLEEMRHCGLSFDTQTASILNRVDSTINALANNRSSGTWAKTIMTMPEYERSVRDRIRQWHKAVGLSVKERELDIEY